ncbi:MAG: GIY-YIG nuclease family protein [Gammaproteobacteria bacterium]
MADHKSNKALLEELGVEVKQEKKASHTPREERIIAGFEEIQRFVDEHGHLPGHGEDKDIFERLYAARLEQIRSKEECRKLVIEMDYQGLLKNSDHIAEPPAEYKSDKEILAELGVDAQKESDVTVLKHVKPRSETRIVDEIANRVPCENFDLYKNLFETVQNELHSGLRDTIPYKDFAKVSEGDFFILTGQKVYVAEVGEEFINKNGHKDSRLKVVYDNGTESNILLRSLQRALNKDDKARRITSTALGPLFDGISNEEDIESGTIYVLRSKSELPKIKEHQDVIHKIGVTGGKIESRIAKAKVDPTFLMAEVEVAATYELYNINRVKLEHIIHKFFECARLDIEINDRFGNPVIPKEWFLVPLHVIDEVVELIKNGKISNYKYDVQSASLIQL